MTIIVQYNMVCSGCGLLLGDTWQATGLDSYRLAAQMGWYGQEYGNENYCPECVNTPEGFHEIAVERGFYPLSDLRMPSVMGPPKGYEPPELVNAGKGTGEKVRGVKLTLTKD